LCLFSLALSSLLSFAQSPTSRVIPENAITTLANVSTQTVTAQLWTAPTGGTFVFSEVESNLKVGSGGTISFLFGSHTTNGLPTTAFASGTSLYLAIVQNGVSVSEGGHIPMYATSTIILLSWGGFVKKVLLALCSLLVFVSASFAAGGTPAPSNASLNGTYAYQLSDTNAQSFQYNYTCPAYTTTTSYDPATGLTTTVTTQTGSTNQQIYGTTGKVEVNTGTVTFDGKGGVTGVDTSYSKFDYSATLAAAQTVANCPQNVYSVQPVYDAPSTSTFTGTYSIQADGTGAMVLTIAGSTDKPSMILRVAGANAKGLRSTVYMFGFRTSDNSADTAGSATLQ
jgi:hypothetical protein